MEKKKRSRFQNAATGEEAVKKLKTEPAPATSRFQPLPESIQKANLVAQTLLKTDLSPSSTRVSSSVNSRPKKRSRFGNKEETAEVVKQEINPYLSIIEEEEQKVKLQREAGNDEEGGSAVKKEERADGKADGEVEMEGDDMESSLMEVAERQTQRLRKRNKAFQFVERGKYEKMAEYMRKSDAHKARVEERKKKDARRHYRDLFGAPGKEKSKANISGGTGKEGDGEETTENAIDVEQLEDETLKRLSDLREKYKLPIDRNNPTYQRLLKLPEGDDQSVGTSDLFWWDAPYLPSNHANGADLPSQLSLKNLANKEYKLIEHNNNKVLKIIKHRKVKLDESMPLIYTKKERKKLKRQAKKEKIRILQEQIAMGLIPAPKNKVSLRTMMKTINYDQDIGAIANPSSKEKSILAEVGVRKENHDLRNMIAKKTPAEKWKKKLQKIRADTFKYGEVLVSVFKVGNLTEPKTRAASLRYKLDINAQKFAVAGMVLIVDYKQAMLETGRSSVKKTEFEDFAEDDFCNLVIVEGGPKRMHAFHKLMNRINWDAVPRPVENGTEEDSDMEVDISDETKQQWKNRCKLVWSGYLPKPSFASREFLFENYGSTEEARNYLKEKDMESFWDLAIQTPL